MIIREAKKTDINGIKIFLDKLYEYKFNNLYYDWQLFNNPNTLKIYLCSDNKKIVGLFGLQLRTINNKIKCGQISWINIHQNYRGQGIFDKLYKSIIPYTSKLDILFIFANKSAIIPCEKIIGLKFIGELDRLLINPEVAEDKNCNYNLDRIVELNKYPNLYKGEAHYSFDQDQKYFTWRYKDNPVNNYYLVSTAMNRYSIIKTLDIDNKIIGDIVDYNCSNDAMLHYKKLIKSTIHALSSLDAKTIITWGISSSKYRESLIECGFIPTKHASYFGIKVLNSKYDYLYKFDNWNLVMSDATNY